MKKQTFQHAELRDEHNEIIQEGTYGKYSDFSNEQNSGFIDYVMNNLEWLKRHMGGNGETNFTDYTFKIGNVTKGAEPKITSRIDGTTIFMDFVLPQGIKGEQGAKGDKGDKGDPTATIEIGNVKTVAPNEKAKIVNVGTKTNVILDIYVPQGIKGEKGDTPSLDGYYNKVETDSKFQLKGNYATKEDIVRVESNKADKSSLRGLATTDYVDGRIKHVVGTAPEALDTLGEIATVLTTNKDKIGTIIGEISTKADRGTVENALMGKADKNKVEKALTDKADKNNVYTKEEVNEKVETIPKNVYSKDEIDEKINKIPKIDTSEFVKMKNGHIVLGEYEIWIEE